jgi:hypothetical protein
MITQKKQIQDYQIKIQLMTGTFGNKKHPLVSIQKIEAKNGNPEYFHYEQTDARGRTIMSFSMPNFEYFMDEVRQYSYETFGMEL